MKPYIVLFVLFSVLFFTASKTNGDVGVILAVLVALGVMYTHRDDFKSQWRQLFVNHKETS